MTCKKLFTKKELENALNMAGIKMSTSPILVAVETTQ